MSADLLTALVVFAFVAAATPGPNNMMLLTSGVNYGFRRTIPHMAGITLGFAVMIALIGFGIGQLFDRLPWLYDVLRGASVSYMLWLAWHIANAGPIARDVLADDARPMSFLEAAAFQWVNPKAWATCLTAVAAYTLPIKFTLSMIVVISIFALVTIPVVAMWTVFGVSLRGLLADPRRVRIFNVVMALALVASLWPILADYWR